MNKIQVLTSLCVSALSSATFMSPIVAHAATSTHSMVKSRIVLNGKQFSDPYKFVGGLPKTTYEPIYYVQQLINAALNINSNADVWNGNTHTWAITVSGKTPKVISHGVGSAVVINGVTIEDAPTIADVDPASGKPTTFMPVWYVQQLLNQVLGLNGTTDKWNGAATVPTWTLTTNSVATTGGSSTSSTAGSGTASNIPTDAQLQAHAKALYDEITWKVEGNYRVFTAPLELDNSKWQLAAAATPTGSLHYSLNNGSTWDNASPQYNSLDNTEGGVSTTSSGVNNIMFRVPVNQNTFFTVAIIGAQSNAVIGKLEVNSSGQKTLTLKVIGTYTG